MWRFRQRPRQPSQSAPSKVLQRKHRRKSVLLIHSSTSSESETTEEANASAFSSGLAEPTSLEPQPSNDANSTSSGESNGNAPQAVTVKRMPLSEEAPPEKKRPELSPLVEPLQAPLPPMTKNMQNLRNKVRTVLKAYYNKPLNSHDNDHVGDDARDAGLRPAKPSPRGRARRAI